MFGQRPEWWQDTVFNASGLSFDSLPKLRTFLGSSQAASEAIGGLVKIRGVRFDDGLGDDASPPQPGDLYHVILGLAKLVTPLHMSKKKHSNITLHLDLAQGANDGLLKVIVATRNKCGVAAGSPLVMDYGMEYDHDIVAEQVAATGRDPKRLKGLLDNYFAKLSAVASDGLPSPGSTPVSSPAKPAPAASQGSSGEEKPSPHNKRRVSFDKPAPAASQGQGSSRKAAKKRKSALKAHDDDGSGSALKAHNDDGSECPSQEEAAGETPTQGEEVIVDEPTPKPEEKDDSVTSEVVIGNVDTPFKMCLVWDTEAQEASLVAQEPLSGNKKIAPLTFLAYTIEGKAPFVGVKKL